MIIVRELNKEEIELCFELDSETVSLWSKKQWANELKKTDTKVFGLINCNLVIAICVFQVVLDEAQINFFAVSKKFQRRGFGTYLMKFLIKKWKELEIRNIFLEVSVSNAVASDFYRQFDFFTVGIRKNYYRDGSDALLKEKKL